MLSTDLLHHHNEILVYILEMLDLEAIHDMVCFPISTTFHKIANERLLYFKKNTPIYDYILRQDKTNEELMNIPILFFKMTFFRNHFQDFKKYMFYILEIILKDEFILVSRLMKLYYVKKIDDNTVFLFFNHDDKNIYYSVIEKRIKFQSEYDIPQSGFILSNGEPQEYTDAIMKMIK